MSDFIPSGWSYSTVGDACSIRNDLRLPISREERECMAGGYPYYGPTGELSRIDHYRLDGTFALIGEDGDHFLDAENKSQTILFTGQFNVNNHAHVIESTVKCSAEWFSNYFQHRSLKPFLTRQGAGRYKLNKAALQSIPVLLPPIPEQRAISGILGFWQVAIQNVERLISAKGKRLESAKARLYALSERMGGQSRFGDFLTESSSTGTNGLHARKLSIRLYGKGVIAKDEKRTGSERTQYFVRNSGQLVFSKLDFLNGAFGIVPDELDGYESTQDLPAFEIDSSAVDPDWLLGYLTRPIYYTRQIGMARGQRKARRVHPSDFLASSLCVPPLDVQREIAAALRTMKEDIVATENLLGSLKTQKRGLMQKLLTGQWRIKVEEAEVPA